MENTSARSTKKSVKAPDQNGTQRSGQDVARPSTLTVPPSLRSEEALKCMLLLLRAFAGEMMSPQVLKLVFLRARKEAKELGIEDSEKHLDELAKATLRERYQNPLNAALDRIGFW